ncbi:hypothetical protein NXV20_24320 [Bacteroides thetaiotaomicron]|uniref:hypothetical protein n=1 Tax=Bacteroides thetaiotaomicron TaxID=818 RepID=UPI002165C18D|nr:hypothetical protein [Bacteroides thetaiotaomicron]MCS2829299.1 hypothetical protein [Bacteroides thetaiotaomicron]
MANCSNAIRKSKAYDEDLDNIKKDMPVSSEAEGWNFVYEDLKFAGEHLPVDKTLMDV